MAAGADRADFRADPRPAHQSGIEQLERAVRPVGSGRCRQGSWREVSPWWVMPDESVDRLPDEVGMAVVPRVLLDHVEQDVAQTG